MACGEEMYLKTSVAIVNRDDHVRKKMRIKKEEDVILERPGPSRVMRRDEDSDSEEINWSSPRKWFCFGVLEWFRFEKVKI